MTSNHAKSSKRMLLSSSLLLTALSIAATAAAEERPPALKPQLIDDETFTESYTAIADLEDGTYAKIQIGISNAGPGDGNGGCRLYLMGKDGVPINKSQVVKR